MWFTYITFFYPPQKEKKKKGYNLSDYGGLAFLLEFHSNEMEKQLCLSGGSLEKNMTQ